MPKLSEDPKVAALLEKAEAKAIKAERQRITAIIKEQRDNASTDLSSSEAGVVKAFVKGVLASVKETADA
jgi:hypothetical protein